MKFLCAVTKKDDRYYQVLTEATLHNIPLRIMRSVFKCGAFLAQRRVESSSGQGEMWPAASVD